jgi:hypothetical protein
MNSDAAAAATTVSQETVVVANEVIELAVAESVSTTTFTTLSQPLQQQWGHSTSAYYPNYNNYYYQQQQHPFQQGGNFWQQNYAQWPQQQNQYQHGYQGWGGPQQQQLQQCQELANFDVELFNVTDDDDDDSSDDDADVDVGREVHASLMAPEHLREELRSQQAELSQSEAVLKGLQAAAEKLKEEEVRRHCPTLPADLAAFLTSVACLDSTSQVGLETKVVQLREGLQRKLLSLAETETARRGDDAKRLNQEFKVLAQKVCCHDLADIFRA